MTRQEMREQIIEDCNLALHYARGVRIDNKQKAIITAQRDLFAEDDEVLDRLYERIPANLRS